DRAHSLRAGVFADGGRRLRQTGLHQTACHSGAGTPHRSPYQSPARWRDAPPGGARYRESRGCADMNPIAEFRQYWNRLNSTVMSGDKLVTPPWRYDFENIDIFKENPLRRNLALREIFYSIAWLSVFLGLIAPSFRILIVTGL